MSQHPNSKGKDASKKYTSVNLNQTYRGSKGENKSAQGNRNHGGLQSLGKIQARRITPATLPSLKSENLGNDPRVPLVPSGGSGGWVKKEPLVPQKRTDAAASPSSGQTKQAQVVGKQGENQEISLRPNAGVVPAGKQADNGVKTWVNKANPSQKSDSPYFQKEFPTLGKEDLNKDPDKKDQSEEGDPNVNLQAMAHQHALNGQKWMETVGMPPPQNMPFHGERSMYNGNQMPPYPYVFPGGRMPMPYPYFYPGGKMPDPNFMQRMSKQFTNQPTNKSDRPSIVKDSDLKDLDQDKDESGWDAAQDEVDYNAKLTFDESDDSDNDNSSEKKNKDKDARTKDKFDPQKEKEQGSWPAGYPNFPPQMMNWSRMQFPPGYEPPRGAPPPGPHGYPIHPMFFMHYGIPPNMQQHMQQQQQQQQHNKDKQDNQSQTHDKNEKEKLAPQDDKTDTERRTATKAEIRNKLKSVDEQMKKRELEKQRHEDMKIEDIEQTKRESQDSVKALPRSRNDSEASDSSRRGSKEVPPRFQRKRSGQSESNIEEDNDQKTVDGTHMRIMKRKESTESQKEESKKVSKNTEIKESSQSMQSIHDIQDKSPQQRQSSEKKLGRVPLKGELKDLSESRREKDEKSGKRDHYEGDRPKKSEPRSSSNQRFNDMKLSRGNKKISKEENFESFHQKTNNEKEKVSNKPSPWNKVVSSSRESEQSSKTIVEIQKEEEEQSRKQETVVSVKSESDQISPKQSVGVRQSPDENKFRSDNVDRYRSSKGYSRSERPKYDSSRTDGTDRTRRSERNDRPERTDRNEKKRYDENRNFNEKQGDKKSHETYRKDDRDDYRKDYKRDDRRSDNREYQQRKDNREDRRDREKRDRPPRKEYDKPVREKKWDKRDDKKFGPNVPKSDPPKKQEGAEPKRIQEGKRFEKKDDQRKEYREKDDNRRDYRDKRYNDRDKRYNDRDNREKRYPDREDGDKRYGERRYRDETKNEKRRNDDRSNRQDWKQNLKKGDENLNSTQISKQKESAEEAIKFDNAKTEIAKTDDTSSEAPKVDENKIEVEVDAAKPSEEVEEEIKSESPTQEKLEFDTKEGKQAKTGGSFGLPGKRDDGRKTDRYDQRKTERRDRYENRGEYTQRGRGGRGGRRGSSDHHQYSRGGGRDYHNRTEKISSEVSGVDDDAEKGLKHQKKARAPNWEDTPPRFRQQSGRGRGASSSRGRGRGRSLPSEHYRSGNNVEKKEESKIEDETEHFFSAEESQGSHSSEEIDEKRKQNYERKPRPSSSSQPREKRGSLEYKRSRGGGRGSSRGSRNGSFLVNRQQVGEKDVLRKGGDGALPAAEESNGSKIVVTHPVTTIEEISAHSPPKRVKTLPEKREEKKRDISREFDLNNIASVVCIDDMPNPQEQQSDKASDDGFVMVTSKKHQKEQRDRAREEEKKKQKKEIFAAVKHHKERASVNRRESSKDAAVMIKGNKSTVEIVSTSSTDQSTVALTSVTTSIAMSSTTTTSAVTAPASNAAMAAIGGWEPAQSLMRTSQQPAAELSKPVVTNVNAWQRPLTLTSSAPDPRAVGTGKPNSSQASSLKTNLVPSQPTPESASPLVTPPALTPIGSTSVSLAPALPVKVTSSEKSVNPESVVKTKEENTKPTVITSSKKDTDDRNEKRRGNTEKNTDVKKESKITSKRSAREKPPRFQTSGKKEGQNTEGRSSKYTEKKYGNERDRRDTREEKSRKRTADRQRKNDVSKVNGEVPKESNKTVISERPPKQISVSKNSRKHSSDEVFTTTIVTSNIQSGTTSKSVLSDADKVVGSKKPLLKSQSSIGSYTAIEEDVVEIQLQSETFKEPFVLSQSNKLQEDDKLNANQATHSVIKSLNDDEKSLETRSLPGSPPPLVVKIPEPTLSGPSSDPGRAPSPTSNKGQAPSMDHEMNEMNRKLFNTRKVWESTSSWSESQSSTVETQVAAVSSIGVVSTSAEVSVSATMINTEKPVSPTKSLPDTTPISSAADTSRSAEEKPSIAPGFSNVPKRSEQQICKVKPQQQQQPAHSEDNTRLNQTKVSTDRNINVQNPLSTSNNYTSYVLPNRHSSQYAGTESAYTESFRSPNNQFASLGNQLRSAPHSVSAISQQQRDAMLSSLQLGNLYGTSNPLLTWQMIPSSTMQQVTPQPNQQPKTVAYPAPPNAHASLFTSQSPMSNNQLIMQYDTNFDPQRTSSSLPRQPVNLMALPQQQQKSQQHTVSQTNALVGMIPTTAAHNARPLRKDQLFRNVNHPDLQQNMAFLLNHNSILQQQQLAAQQAQNTDLTKHVNAKPFEPTTQAPLIQSPPIMQATMALAQQQLVSTMYRPSSATNINNIAPSHHVQGLNRQQILPAQQRQNIPSSMRHQPSQLVASVRPRSAQPMNAANSLSRSQMNVSDRVTGMPMQYPKANIQNVISNSRRQGPIGQVPNLSMPSQTLQNHYVHASAMQQRTNARNVNVQSVPGPIQRPSQVGPVHQLNYPSLQQQQHQQQQSQPLLQQQPPVVNESVDFKKIQRQKMLEDTKKYFQKEQQQQNVSSISPDKESLEEKPLSNGSSIIDDNDADRLKGEGVATKKVSSNKNLTGDRDLRNSKARPASGNDVKKKRDGPPQPPTQHNRRNVPSKV